MPQVSRIPLDHQTQHQVLDTLDLVLGKLKKDETRAFLFSLLSKTERVMVAKRFTAILLLKQGKKISDIAKTINMTESTIRKLGMQMQIKNQGFEVAFKMMKDEKIAEEINNILISLAKYSARAAGGRVKL